ncbi:hypothetical protein [Stutzerimonas nitrititolerans]|uniref:hypothetical protein n=1 Tax=Stutzerimonas nitrititolerans TaxID=2482751 RepID=UPI002897AB1D|nr:hypothetical protein [Stutzerimonas nitrititolerans]
MRQGSLSVLFALCLLAPALQAQEPDSQPAPEPEATPQQRLEVAPPQDAVTRETSAQLIQLREENQRLKALLQQQQANAAAPLLNDQQQWFAVGGGVGVLGFLFGVLATRGRRRRQWLN